MSIQNYWYLIKKRLFHNRVLLWMNLFLSIASLSLLAFSIGIPQVLAHGRRSIQKSLEKDMKYYGVMSNSSDTYQNEHLTDYLAALYAAEEIDSVGMWHYTGISGLKTKDGEEDLWSELLRIHNSNRKAFDDEQGGYVQAAAMSYQALNFHKFKMYKEASGQEYSKDAVRIYLGYDFRSIPVGTVFYSGEGENYHEYVVAGIFEKGTTMLDWRALLMNSNSLTLSYTIPLDNMMVAQIREQDNGYMSLDNFFSCAEGYSYEEAVTRIKEISKEFGIVAETESLPHRVNSIMGITDWLLTAVRKIAMLISFAALVILLSAQLLTLLRRKNELGIWVTCGISKKQVLKIIFLENLIKLLIAAVVTMVISFGFWKMMKFDSSVYYDLRFVIYVNVNIMILLIALVMTFIVSWIPMRMIEKRSLQAVVKGDFEKNEAGAHSIFHDQPVISAIFLLSFVASFFTMYYGLDLFRQTNAIAEERVKAEYADSTFYRVFYKPGISDLDRIPLPETENGNIVVQVFVPMGEEAIHPYPVDLIIVQNEPLRETVFYTENDSSLGENNVPLCLLGNKYRNEVEREGNQEYFKIFGVRCRVAGYFADASIQGLDYRCTVFADSLSDEQMKKLLFRSDYGNLIIKSSSKLGDADKDAFFRWAESIRDPESIDAGAIRENYKESYDDGELFDSFMPMYQKIYFCMICLCFVNCAFLAFVWGGMHSYEFMLFRTLGFSKSKIVAEIIKRYLLYELPAFLGVLAVTFFYEAICGGLTNWGKALSGGFGIIAVTFLVFGVLLSLFPIIWVMKLKPADVLKCTE